MFRLFFKYVSGEIYINQLNLLFRHSLLSLEYWIISFGVPITGKLDLSPACNQLSFPRSCWIISFGVPITGKLDFSTDCNQLNFPRSCWIISFGVSITGTLDLSTDFSQLNFPRSCWIISFGVRRYRHYSPVIPCYHWICGFISCLQSAEFSSFVLDYLFRCSYHWYIGFIY